MSDEKSIEQRIREALDAELSVHVVGYDPAYDIELGGRVQEMQELRDGWYAFFRDETVGGPFHGRRVGLRAADITDVRVA